jgi:LacI family transcriptional regulator
VAEKAGVNITSASVVLNGNRSNTRVSQATRERIIHAASELRYSPNVTARGLKRARFNSLGVCFSYTNRFTFPNPINNGEPAWMTADYYGAYLLNGILRAAHDAEYNVTHFHKPWRGANQSASGFRGQGIDGFLIVAPQPESDIVSGLSAVGMPLVVISSSSDQYGVPSVDVDNAMGTRLALEHLLALGHRRIVHLFVPNNHFDTFTRKNTFLKVMGEAGMPEPRDYLVEASQDRHESVRRLLAAPNRPTAVFTSGDLVAVELMAAARDLGINIPEDLSVVGFDDSPAASMTTPPLTTVRQPLVQMAEEATKLLISLVEGRPVPAETHLFEPEMVVRSTTRRRNVH